MENDVINLCLFVDLNFHTNCLLKPSVSLVINVFNVSISALVEVRSTLINDCHHVANEP